LLGVGLGGYGVIAGWAIAIAAGSAVILFSGARRQGLPQGHLWPRTSRILTGACLASAGAAVVLRLLRRAQPASLGVEVAAVVPLVMLIAAAVWFHPLRPRLLSWIRVDLLGLRRAQRVE
jgi:peptidoglycan/LPS O-acetylase OafA/YrhL